MWSRLCSALLRWTMGCTVVCFPCLDSFSFPSHLPSCLIIFLRMYHSVNSCGSFNSPVKIFRFPRHPVHFVLLQKLLPEPSDPPQWAGCPLHLAWTTSLRAPCPSTWGFPFLIFFWHISCVLVSLFPSFALLFEPILVQLPEKGYVWVSEMSSLYFNI